MAKTNTDRLLKIAQYNRENTIMVGVHFNRKNEEEMALYEHLLTKGNNSGYLKKLLKDDMEEENDNLYRIG